MEIGVKQREDEPFEEYKIRMTTAFKTHSGLQDDNQPNGPFQQQLKNALHAGSKDAIHSWVTKHYIGLPTGTLDEYVNHALHAEKVVKEKNKSKKAVETFYHDMEEILYQRGARGRGINYRGRRGGVRRGGAGKGDYRQNTTPFCCWSWSWRKKV